MKPQAALIRSEAAQREPEQKVKTPQEATPSSKKHFELGHAQCLDGVRAIAVLAVMGTHFRTPLSSGGHLGVDIFFVLSGFLITSLLLEEHRAFGNVSLKNFYVRRALRLLPALVLMLAAWFTAIRWFG